MTYVTPNGSKQNQKAPLNRCVDARLTGVPCRCGVRLHGLNEVQSFGIGRTRTGHLWHRIPVANPWWATRPEFATNEPEQSHFHDGHT